MSSADSTRIKKVVVKDYYFYQLVVIYDTTEWKLRKKLKRIADQLGENEGSYGYDAKQVSLIFKLIPLPSNVEIVHT